MGQSFSMLAKGLKEAFGHWGKVGFHKGLPTVKDIPVLIKALALNGPGIADEAHSALVWLSGGDLGRDPAAWSAWWKTYGAELARREADENAARDLFLNVKRDILTGRWDAVGRALSARLRARARPDELERFLVGSAALLRKVYRAARVKELRLDGDSGTLVIDWGKSGFEFTEIALVREGGAWKFARAPWGRRVVRQAQAEVRTNGIPLRARYREPVFGSGDVLDWMVLIGGVVFFFFAFIITAIFAAWYVSAPLAGALVISLACALARGRGRKGKRKRRAAGRRRARTAGIARGGA